MNDHLAATPDLGIEWCPRCRPDRDPTREILETRWCAHHAPALGGSADHQVAPGPIGGYTDAGGDYAREFSRLLGLTQTD